MRRIVSGAVVLLAAAVLLVSYLNGWWSDPTTSTTATDSPARPQTEVSLPAESEAGYATSAYPNSTVDLAVGQQLGVRMTGGARPKNWYLTSPADGAVLRNGPDVVISSCSSNPPAPGCASEFDRTFTALAPGTTTLTWAFGNEVDCAPDAPNRVALRCDVTKSIQVTVR
ncbi:hypothetical protein ACIG0C_32430 [Kitasatospora aureofaciens]|uniref:Proteinase inhibitor I42 chagasin domain-containing protein n=1 Tax=Kitasatospora aureofaciens TaxID=1894 RepID=A0A1E7NE11_KITAU|nr:hypothetical protein [Kitasatospora aureofaciens]ARF81293.1 hypothetical protein B6264_22450 [Kitasatospora aureofaciens]OEV38885.1 hypothetical protein HS99_0019715 [Kitasatospora aureofaciens]GGU54185.1 hypothetical protein GCM10010502_00260 [Kitasatospora aureofaciens]